MISHLQALFPIAFGLIGAQYDSTEARAMLLVIALQESGCLSRSQHDGGPAKSLWQFEKIGIRGLLENPKSRIRLKDASMQLKIEFTLDEIHRAIEFNDILAIVCSRLLLAQDPRPLPKKDNPEEAWEQYLALWRPGRPDKTRWDRYFPMAWDAVTH